MNAEVAGADYVAAMKREARDRECRLAFQEFVLARAPRGARLLDFGCGPGIDARRYAAAGCRVDAFDTSRSMRNYFAAACAREIAAGSVRLLPGDYAAFLRAAPDVPADLIVANFAPFNLVDDLPELLQRLAARLAPRGKVLASMLNPFFGALVRSNTWWRNLPRLVATGSYVKPLHGTLPVHRHTPGRLARAALPRLALRGVFAPLPGGSSVRRVRPANPFDLHRIAATQFLFVEWEHAAR